MLNLIETKEPELLEKPSVQNQPKENRNYSLEKFPLDEFREMMPVLYKQYKTALENDRKSEDRIFVWAERNAELSQRSMFKNAMTLLIDVEYLQIQIDNDEKLSPSKINDLEYYIKEKNTTLLNNYGPKNTKSYDVINQMRATVQIAYSRNDNFTNQQLLASLNNSNFEK